MRKQNSYCLKEKLHSELYAEIDRMEPVFWHLLAAQLRGKAKEGMSSLRQSVSPSSSTPPQQPAHELDEGGQDILRVARPPEAVRWWWSWWNMEKNKKFWW